MTAWGHASLLVGLGVAVYGTVAAFLGGFSRRADLWASARRSAYLTFLLSSLAALILLRALLVREFRLEYVALHSSWDLPLSYAVSALWAGQEGSLLLWLWMLALFGALLLLQFRRRPEAGLPFVLGGLLLTQSFFFLLLAVVSSPFKTLPFTPADGQGLNPLLQNPAMFWHPVTQYLGYVGFTVPFAFAMAALITGRTDEDWIRNTRTWTTVSWLFLTLGMGLGAQWAYVELGWGGYWAWDPVENASLLPWLTGTAFLHSVMIQERRGMLKVWNLVLVMLTFALSIFGTFITRSGILQSVHAFGDTALGPFFMVFLALTVFSFLALLVQRLDALRSEGELDALLSREASFLFNNLLLVGIAFAVFWGTIFPLVSEAVTHRKVTVGAPFFNQVAGPLFLALILLMGLCPLVGWRRTSTRSLKRNFLFPLVGGLVVLAGLLVRGTREMVVLAGYSTAGFVALSIALEVWRGWRARRRHGEGPVEAALRLVSGNRRRYGGYLVHVGVVMAMVGIVASSAYQREASAVLLPGESLEVGGYRLFHAGLTEYPAGDHWAVSARIEAWREGRLLGVLTPEKHLHPNSEQPMTEVAIRSTPAEDLYLILASYDTTTQAVGLKALVNPLMLWMWVGGLLAVLGSLYAVWPTTGPSPGFALSGRTRRAEVAG